MNEQIKSYWPLNKSEITILGIIFLLFLLFFASIRILRYSNPYAVSTNSTLDVYVESKWSIPELARFLKKKNVIKSEANFIWTAHLVGYKSIQVGHYSYTIGTYSVQDFLPKMGKGIQDPILITILPGQTLDKLSESISRQFRFTKEEFDSFISDEERLQSIGITKTELLGRLLPETYSMFWTWSPKQVIQETNAYVMRIIESAESIKTTTLSTDEVITLASIVQWEAANNEEKPIIAGLYLNRLKRKWKLQADPTVNFSLGERRRLIYADYLFKHPYNTYLNSGLPPGPITNPDEQSIKAVLNPAVHRFMYMVASPEGAHDFSVTYEEHQRKSERWTRWLRKQYRIKRERELESAK